jgi:energy-coupled thiamine transporter ThiT
MLAEGRKLNVNTRFRTVLILAEISVFVATAAALSLIKIFQLPQGGSVTAGSMVPLIWLSLRRGPKIGLTACAVYGLVQLALEPFIFNPAQVLVDYPIAFGVLGLAGFFNKWPSTHISVPPYLEKLVAIAFVSLFLALSLLEFSLFAFTEGTFFFTLFILTFLMLLWLLNRTAITKPPKQQGDLIPALLGSVVGITGRFVAHFASGVWFFGPYAPPGMSPIVYAAIYNGSYLVPELIVTMYFMYLIAKTNLLRMYT